MDGNKNQPRLATLRDYAAGRTGTREAIARAGLSDYADLVIALAQNGLSLPRPADTARRRASIDEARSILQPRLRRAG